MKRVRKHILTAWNNKKATISIEMVAFLLREIVSFALDKIRLFG